MTSTCLHCHRPTRPTHHDALPVGGCASQDDSDCRDAVSERVRRLERVARESRRFVNIGATPCAPGCGHWACPLLRALRDLDALGRVEDSRAPREIHLLRVVASRAMALVANPGSAAHMGAVNDGLIALRDAGMLADVNAAGRGK
jgi:hypothetical protein